MKVAAPGKLILTGAYAVLEGAPAIVVAVDRYAVADDSIVAASASREVRAAIGEEPAPEVDARALNDGDKKLGLGSSAAVLVATLGARRAARGEDLMNADVRASLFQEARDAHAAAQNGGSGADVAASVYGGVIVHSMRETPRAMDLPAGLFFDAVWSGTSARTSELRAHVDAFRDRDPGAYGECIRALRDASRLAFAHGGSAARFLDAARSTSRALAALGRSAGAPIVPPAFADLGALAEREDAAFYPSGAGGGDVGVFLGTRPPSAAFLEQLRVHGMCTLHLALDRLGVHVRKAA